MKFSFNWLKTWVNCDLGVEKLAHLLTMSGLEVESIAPCAPEFTLVVVAEVLTVSKHPAADRLQIASVNIGSPEPLQIVCGAPNVKAGIKVPCALVGAVLPGNFKIKPAHMRGVDSNGMLCSARELGLPEQEDGLLILPADAPTGTDLRAYLTLDDQIIEIKSTPNRADCLSIAGIAREVAALTATPLTPLAVKPVKNTIDFSVPATISSPAACGRFVTRAIKGVKAAVTTPVWIKERLERSGIRSLNFLVDVGNYVMLELGQPLHIFDLAKITPPIDVRYAREGEELLCLNGKEVQLKSDTLIIADAKGSLSIAGLMGGAATAVSDNTVDILIEAAFFYPEVIAGKSRQYGFGSESSYRLERGVDYNLQQQALERAAELISTYADGKAAAAHETLGKLPVPKNITLRLARAEKLLGITLNPDKVKEDFTRLGFKPQNNPQGFTVTAPSFRFDLNLEVDLIEEIARLYGYDNIRPQHTSGELFLLPQPGGQTPEAAVAAKIAALGYQEVINYAFVSTEWEEDFAGNNNPVPLINPIASQMNVMRSTLIGSLVHNLSNNQHRKQNRVRIFEIAKTFKKSAGNLIQENYAAALAYGELYPETWGNPRGQVDFFAIKNDLEQLLKNKEVSFLPGTHPALHPGRSALIEYENNIVGYLGELHPHLQQKYELPHAPYLFEIKYDVLSAAELCRYQPISKYQPVRRDLAFIVPLEITAAELLAKLRCNQPPALKSLTIFDVYHNEGIAENSKGIAVKLIFQDADKTLQDQEIEIMVQKLVTQAAKIGARLRT